MRVRELFLRGKNWHPNWGDGLFSFPRGQTKGRCVSEGLGAEVSGVISAWASLPTALSFPIHHPLSDIGVHFQVEEEDGETKRGRSHRRGDEVIHGE